MIHPPIKQRTSPRAFDALANLSEAELEALLEAARWAPSAMNRQPWSFLVGLRGDRTFKGIADALAPGNQIWAPAASALLVALVDNKDPEAATDPGRAYEVGLAMGQLGIQAVAMGLITHQMGGFSADRLREEFSLPAHLRPLAAVAIGRPGDAADLPADLQEREQAPRLRKPLHEVRYSLNIR